MQEWIKMALRDQYNYKKYKNKKYINGQLSLIMDRSVKLHLPYMYIFIYVHIVYNIQ